MSCLLSVSLFRVRECNIVSKDEKFLINSAIFLILIAVTEKN